MGRAGWPWKTTSALVIAALLTVSCGDSESAETTVAPSTPAPSSTTEATAASSTTVTSATTATQPMELPEILAKAVERTFDQSFRFEMTLRAGRRQGLGATVEGFVDVAAGRVLEDWYLRSIVRLVVVDGKEVLGKPDLFVTGTPIQDISEFSWVAIPQALAGAFQWSFPEPSVAPEFRFAPAIRDLVMAATSVSESRSDAIATDGGMVILEQYELSVPVEAVLPMVGNAAESLWVRTNAAVSGFDVLVRVGVDADGFFRALSFESQRLGDLFVELFDDFVAEGFKNPKAKTVIEITELDPQLYDPLAGVRLATVEAADFLDGSDRPPVGSCVFEASEFGWPSFGEAVPCEYRYAPTAFGSFSVAGASFPGYSALAAEGTERCTQMAAERLGGDDALAELKLEIVYAFPNPGSWVLGDRTTVCGFVEQRY